MRALGESTPLFAGETQNVSRLVQQPHATRQSGSPEHSDWHCAVHVEVDVDTLASAPAVSAMQRLSETWLQIPISVCALNKPVTAAHVCGTPTGQRKPLQTQSTSSAEVPSRTNPQFG